MCPAPEFSQTEQVVSDKKSTNPDEVVVESDKAKLARLQKTEFRGNVVIYQQNQTVKADEAIFDEEKSQFIAQGNVELNSEAAQVRGESIFIDEINKDFALKDANYQFGFNAGRGTADLFAIEKSQALNLKGATFTTCPEQDPSWLFSSGQIKINHQDGWGEAWNTVFKIKDMPIVYVPYITFPVTEQRKSGLLFPSFGSSSRLGAYYEQPIYYNWAENKDVTFTPTYMSDRGWKWAANIRHMSEQSYNTFQLEFMNEDEAEPELEQRFLAYWQHDSNWGGNWNIQLQYTELSDDNYISEFSSDYHHQADTHLNNFIIASYYSDDFHFSFLSQDMLELGPHTPSYQVPVQLEFDWVAKRISEHLSVNLNGQYTHFRNDAQDVDTVDRVHLVPEINFEYYSPGFQFEAAASYLSTFYQKHDSVLDEKQDVDRNIAKFRFLTGLTLEKESEYFGNQVRQTLEPKIQYVFVEESQQDEIGLYDSQRLKEDYFALFRDVSYSGIDRIVPMDQMTIGFSSSIFNSKNNEVFRFGIGQVHKFSDYDPITGTSNTDASSKPALAIEWFGRLSENWQMDGGILYNRDTEEVDTGFISLDYWVNQDNNIQINHRYVRDLADIKINQTGMFSSYKINENWSVAASYHYDSERDVNLDGMIGFEYRSCCWTIQFSAQRQVVLDLNDRDFGNENEIEYDNSIGFKFRINGLGGDRSSSVAGLFADSIFAYRRPYLITN